MSELLPNENLVEDNCDKVLFCRKCGHKLTENSTQCSACGTIIEYGSETDCGDAGEMTVDENIQECTEKETSKKKPKRLGKIILFSALSLILVAAVTLGGLFLWKTRVIKQDINTINGCPEFYNIKFGMTANEASSLIKLKHKAINGIEGSTMFEVDDFMKSSHIIIDEEEVFYLFGRKTSDVYVGFDEKYIESVIFNFSQDDYKLKDIVSLYKKIYGEPTETGTIYSTWSGPKTTIDVFEYDSDDGEKEIVVRYIITPNSQYTSLHFDGTELDPCGFLGENNAFNKKPDYYIKGLKKGDDYNEETYSPEGFPGFSQYTLYPQFEYMGIGKGYTAIEFSKDSDEEYIGLVSYKFLLNEENAVDRMKYIHSKLAEKYDTAVSSTYTSTYYDKMGVTDVSFDEMIKKITADTEGIYNVQWESNGRKFTLGLTISVDKEYYEGSVAFTD